VAQPPQTPGRREQLPALKELSRSVAYVDVALLLGTGILTGIVAVVARRARTATPFLAAGGALASALALALRLGRRSGVTDAEVRRALPGDDLIANPGLVTDRAITIHAPAQDVWPWVVQMGYHRGGWYTSRWLDKLLWRIDNPSADRIIPEFQQLRVGEVVPDGPPGTAHFTVAALEPGRAIVYLDDAGTHVPGTAFSWAFVLEPLDGRTTRVQVRTRGTYPPSPVIRRLHRVVIGPADFVMVSGQMLRGIKRRAERAWASRRGAEDAPVGDRVTSASP
jgi:hypothetical protein